MEKTIEIEKPESLLAADKSGREPNAVVYCFVCTGNTCRSPMAEAYMRSLGYESAFSRGLAARDGDAMSELAESVLRENGIEPPPHRARTITDDDMARADLVYAMTKRHAAALIYAFPQFAGKICVMPREIPDPFGGGIEDYRKAFAEIKSAIAEIIGK